MRLTLRIPKGTTVGVGKGTTFPVTFVTHTMKEDMEVPYPTPDEYDGPVVFQRAMNNMLDRGQLMVLKGLLAETGMFSKQDGVARTSLYGILQFGWDIFVTDNDEYPLLIVHHSDIDETDHEAIEAELAHEQLLYQMKLMSEWGRFGSDLEEEELKREETTEEKYIRVSKAEEKARALNKPKQVDGISLLAKPFVALRNACVKIDNWAEKVRNE